MSAIVISPVEALIWKIPSPLPDTIVHDCSEPTVSMSVPATVPTETRFAAFSAMLKLCAAVTTGAVSLSGS